MSETFVAECACEDVDSALLPPEAIRGRVLDGCVGCVGGVR